MPNKGASWLSCFAPGKFIPVHGPMLLDLQTLQIGKAIMWIKRLILDYILDPEADKFLPRLFLTGRLFDLILCNDYVLQNHGLASYRQNFDPV